jgi:hypothetical protein
MSSAGAYAALTTATTIAITAAPTVASLTETTAQSQVAKTLNFVTTNGVDGAEMYIKITPTGTACDAADGGSDAINGGAGQLTYVSATAATFSFTTAEDAGTDFNVCAGMAAAGAYAALATPDTIDITTAPTCNATAATYTNGAAGTCTNATMASGTTCQSTCNAKYTSAGTSSCSVGTLTVAACTANVCTRPSTAGYVYTSENATNCLLATGTAATCSASLTCATGYTGTPVATLCTSAGPYSVTGCTEATTTTTTTTAPTANTTTAATATTAAKEGLSVASQLSTSILTLFGTMLALFLVHL